MRSGWAWCVRDESRISEAADRAGRPLDGHEVALGCQAGRAGGIGGVAPGVKANGVELELAAARAEIARLSEALKEMGVRLMLAEGEWAPAV